MSTLDQTNRTESFAGLPSILLMVVLTGVGIFTLTLEALS